MIAYKLISPTGHTEIVHGTEMIGRDIYNQKKIAIVPDDWLVIIER